VSYAPPAFGFDFNSERRAGDQIDSTSEPPGSRAGEEMSFKPTHVSSGPCGCEHIGDNHFLVSNRQFNVSQRPRPSPQPLPKGGSCRPGVSVNSR